MGVAVPYQMEEFLRHGFVVMSGAVLLRHGATDPAPVCLRFGLAANIDGGAVAHDNGAR
jgi:hypothetical protein